jgi:hypothetical protein
MGLESLRRRIDERRARLEKARRRRGEELQSLFARAQSALEAALQGHRLGAQAWMEKLAALRAKQEALRGTQAELWGAPARLPEEQKARERELEVFYEQEKARVLREADDYWRAFQEKSAANRAALEKTLAELQASEEDLDRQEARFDAFLAAIKTQSLQLAALRDYFKSGPAREDRDVLPGASVA